MPVQSALLATAPQELAAQPGWLAVDFISDLHLNRADAATFTSWQRYMATTPADAIFILGDLFEAWLGDDTVNPALPAEGGSFEDDCARVLAAAAQRVPVYFLHGNRDFLVGSPLPESAGRPSLTALCSFSLLPDPTVLSFDGQRWLLSHGDALCLADTVYLEFRAKVRDKAWQRAFLERPMAERYAVARELRRQSEASQIALRDAGLLFADVDDATARDWLESADAPVLIHGHTHRPAEHELGGGKRRIVLTDWDTSSAARLPRAEAFRLQIGKAPMRLPLLA